MYKTPETPEQEYLREHPNASLEEYVNYKEEQNKSKFEAEIERDKKCKEWYDSMVGRKFRINFNNDSFCFFILSKGGQYLRDNSLIAKKCYQLLKSTSKLEIENNRFINPLWFKNPYETYFNKSKQTTDLVEITDEEWENIMKIFDEHLQTIEKLKLCL